jgi:hypothetical protein
MSLQLLLLWPQCRSPHGRECCDVPEIIVTSLQGQHHVVHLGRQDGAGVMPGATGTEAFAGASAFAFQVPKYMLMVCIVQGTKSLCSCWCASCRAWHC